MKCHPNRRAEMERMADRLTVELLPPVRRHRGEQPDESLRSLERDVQRRQCKPTLHTITILCGRIDRGESIESVTRYVRALDRSLRAYALRRTPPPDVGALLLRMQAEVGEASMAALRFTGQRCEPTRSALVREVSEARDVMDQVALAAERHGQESAA